MHIAVNISEGSKEKDFSFLSLSSVYRGNLFSIGLITQVAFRMELYE